MWCGDAFRSGARPPIRRGLQF
uniref:Uncharacterized protein n=1 Tax=Arundo donax TaxID=35708 RepID=A0A0A8ZAN3_ARUDO